MMGLRIEGYRLIVEPDELKRESEGGIIIMASDEEAKMEAAGRETGVIRAIAPLAWKAHQIGPGGEHIGKPWAKVGDRIYYSRYGARPIIDPVTKKEYFIISDEDVTCVITEDEIIA